MQIEGSDSADLNPRIASETVDEHGRRGIAKYANGDRLEELSDGTPLFTADQFIAWMYEHPNLARVRQKLEEYGEKVERSEAGR